MKRILICMVVLLLAALPMGAAYAAVVQPGADFYYLDTANVLSQETEGLIYFSNKLLEEKCGAQIVVAALDSIGGADIYDYAVDMGNSWGIGSVEENNGFLLLMAIEEDNYYAVTGRGLDGVFPASTLKEYFDDYLEADFAAKDYDAGARKFFTAVFEKVSDYYNANVSVQDGLAAYEAYASSSAGAANYDGARGGGAASDGPTSVWTSDGHYRDYYEDPFDAFVETAIAVVVVIVVLVIVFGGSRRGRSFIFFGPGVHRHHHHRPHHGPAHRPGGPGRRPPRSGGFGGGAGRGGFGGGGFGGGRGGGGGGFGGGAGRGRH